MRLFQILSKYHVEHWVQTVAGEGSTLYWFGKAATDMGLTGDADPEVALKLLRDAIAPNGERLATFIDGRYEQADGQYYYPTPIVSFALRFCPHDSADEVFKRHFRPVVDAHEAAVKAALVVLEKDMNLALAGVRTMFFSGELMRDASWGYWPGSKQPVFATDALFAASGRYLYEDSHWTSLGSVDDAFDCVLPASQAALATYQLFLGEELAVNLEVGVTYQSSPENNSLPVAVFK